MGTRTLKAWVGQIDDSPEIIVAYEFSNGRTFLDDNVYPFSDDSVPSNAILDENGNPITDENGNPILDS